jgi:hypothetical protein
MRAHSGTSERTQYRDLLLQRFLPTMIAEKENQADSLVWLMHSSQQHLQRS